MIKLSPEMDPGTFYPELSHLNTRVIVQCTIYIGHNKSIIDSWAEISI